MLHQRSVESKCILSINHPLKCPQTPEILLRLVAPSNSIRPISLPTLYSSVTSSASRLGSASSYISLNQQIDLPGEMGIWATRMGKHQPSRNPPDINPIKTKAAQWIPETKNAMLMLNPGINLQRRMMQKRAGTTPYMTVLKSFSDEQ